MFTSWLGNLFFNIFGFARYLHILLIAVNRGYAMLFPMHYDLVWTRRVCILCVVFIWVVGLGMWASALITYYVAGQASADDLKNFLFLNDQKYCTFISVGIYTAVLLFLLLGSVLSRGLLYDKS